MRRVSGEYAARSLHGENFKVFLPAPLPPIPELIWDQDLLTLSEQANRALGRLDGLTEPFPIPNTGLFLYQYIRKEALLSSQIEGTQSSFADLVLFEMEEAPGVPMEDTQEVSNYIAALNHGLERIKSGYPLSLQLIRDLHAILLSSGRGSGKEVGDFRKKQNWIGGANPGSAEFVPPPHEILMDFLRPFEEFLEQSNVPPLIKAGLAHVQFESIHPFEDGNGRLGRLLITLILCKEGVLTEPLLYLSLYFKSRRMAYYDALQKVRAEGDWEEWIRFFLQGVYETSNQAVDTARKLIQQFASDMEKIQELGRGSGTPFRIFHLLQERIILSVPEICENLKVTYPTALSNLNRLEKLEIVREITGKKRNRLFIYHRFLEILSEGTEPISP